MTALSVDMTTAERVQTWQDLDGQLPPMTPAEIALEDARVELALAWREVDTLADLIEQMEHGMAKPYDLMIAAQVRAREAELAHQRAWEALDAEKAAKLAGEA